MLLFSIRAVTRVDINAGTTCCYMHSTATFDLSSDPQLSDNNKPGVWKFRSTEAHCENSTKREGRMNEQVGIVHIVQFKLIRETNYCMMSSCTVDTVNDEIEK